MDGIDLCKPVTYETASMRYFSPGEHHVSRRFKPDVLLLVLEGILRFTEDGTRYEVHPGQYHIQKQDSIQSGEIVSDAPKYLYVHFYGHWTTDGQYLPKQGSFDQAALSPLIQQLDTLSHSHAPYILTAAIFYQLLAALYHTPPVDSTAAKIADYMDNHYPQALTLDHLCVEFHFSKNHIINLFKKAYGVTPVNYLNDLRLQRAKYLMEVTSNSLETICPACGFQNYSHFYKLFVRKNGISPEKWRIKKRAL